MKTILFLLLAGLAVMPARADQVYTDAQGNVTLSTVTMQDLCVNDATSVRCHTMVGGVNHSGRVGINTLTPRTALDVNGTITAGETSVATITTNALYSTDDATVGSSLTVKGTASMGGSFAGAMLVVSTSASVGNPSVFRLSNQDTGGNGGKLEWFSGYPGPGKVTGHMYSNASGANGGDFHLSLLDQGSSLLTDRLSINNGGNVGIGATNPQTTLEVNGSASFGSGVTKTTIAANGAITAPAYISSVSSTPLVAGSTIALLNSMSGDGVYKVFLRALPVPGNTIKLHCNFNNDITTSYYWSQSRTVGGVSAAASASADIRIPITFNEATGTSEGVSMEMMISVDTAFTRTHFVFSTGGYLSGPAVINGGGTVTFLTTGVGCSSETGPLRGTLSVVRVQ